MNTIIKRMIALLAAACLLASLAACTGPAAEEGETGGANTVSENTSGLTETAPVASDPTESVTASSTVEESADRSTGVSAAQPKETAKQAVVTEEKPGAQAQKPGTKAEIVAYFNTAANRVKTQKPGLQKTEKIAFHVQGDGAIAGIANQVQKLLKSTLNPDPISVKKGASHNDAFPVENQSWSSRLSADAVSSASCVEKNGAYTLTIRMKDERISYEQAKKPLQTKHGQVVDILKTSEIEEQMQGLGKLVTLHDLDQTYSGTTITCTVDKQSGEMRSAHYLIVSHATIKASAPFVGDATVDATITFDQTYRF